MASYRVQNRLDGLNWRGLLLCFVSGGRLGYQCNSPSATEIIFSSLLTHKNQINFDTKFANPFQHTCPVIFRLIFSCLVSTGCFMTIIIGIDPGSIRTGYGLIRVEKNQLLHITHGTIHATEKDTATRLHYIHQELCGIIASQQPSEAAIEEVFMQVNVQSALKLGQARGAALIALASHAVPLHEYSARTVKKTATGYGAASKEQVQFMVRAELKLSVNPPADAADALAIAICHAQHRRNGLTKRAWSV